MRKKRFGPKIIPIPGISKQNPLAEKIPRCPLVSGLFEQRGYGG
jgi:hypothetical protein